MSKPKSSMSDYKKKDQFIAMKIVNIDYKRFGWLKKIGVTFFGKIKPRKYNGNRLRTQKNMAVAIKRARFMGLLPFIK
jgi:small subunit ribosomal protein S18